MFKLTWDGEDKDASTMWFVVEGFPADLGTSQGVVGSRR